MSFKFDSERDKLLFRSTAFSCDVFNFEYRRIKMELVILSNKLIEAAEETIQSYTLAEDNQHGCVCFSHYVLLSEMTFNFTDSLSIAVSFIKLTGSKLSDHSARKNILLSSKN